MRKRNESKLLKIIHLCCIYLIIVHIIISYYVIFIHAKRILLMRKYVDVIKRKRKIGLWNKFPDLSSKLSCFFSTINCASHVVDFFNNINIILTN